MSGNVSFGNVNGPVNTGDPVNRGGNQVVGSGNISISGGSRNTYGTDPAVLEALVGLRAQLDGLRLTGSERTAALEDLAGVEHAGEDKPAAASAFESFLGRLKDAGALTRAGVEFIDAVRPIISWLGPLAAGAIALL